MIWFPVYICLFNPLENICQDGKIKNVPNHQADVYLSMYVYNTEAHS